MLELIQQKYFSIITGGGINNFIIEYNEDTAEYANQVEESNIAAS
ncbi:MAG: hypothetical protein ABIO81_07100 [Ginsengibacter sp.]